MVCCMHTGTGVVSMVYRFALKFVELAERVQLPLDTPKKLDKNRFLVFIKKEQLSLLFLQYFCSKTHTYKTMQRYINASMRIILGIKKLKAQEKGKERPEINNKKTIKLKNNISIFSYKE